MIRSICLGLLLGGMLAGCATPQGTSVKDIKEWYGLIDSHGPVESNKPPLSVREAYVAERPELDLGIRNGIINGTAHLSMRKEQVRIAWGDPASILPGGSRYDEVWRYASRDGQYTLLYFLEGLAVREELVTATGRVLTRGFSGLDPGL